MTAGRDLGSKRADDAHHRASDRGKRLVRPLGWIEVVTRPGLASRTALTREGFPLRRS
jgi:hypothetical protein